MVLYNDCWHGFGVRSWWPRVLWRAVTWLVNREMAVSRGRPVDQVFKRKETTWYENHAVRLRQWVQSESTDKPGMLSRSEALGRLWRCGLQGGASVGRPTGSRKRILGKRKFPLWVYESPSISQNYNKLCVFRLFLEVPSLSWIMFFVGSMKCIQQWY